MKVIYFTLAVYISLSGCMHQKDNAGTESILMTESARKVLHRVLGERCESIVLEKLHESSESDTYEYSCKDNILTVKGTSVTAITRGVYDYLKDNGIGMLDWSGPMFNLPKKWPDTPLKRVTTPYRIRHAYNAVTSGYTTPYWSWERWEQELDWQAMHGFNMMMAPGATEAIATRIWKKLGLTIQEIDSFYVGPAHLPFIRMGCISGVGGYLPEEWLKNQIALQHKILKRMRELGIQPVVQSFAGFVPKGLRRVFPDIELHPTLWNPGFPPENRPFFIMPDNKLFSKISKMFMEEWQKEFGDAKYYLVDSFNEQKLPETGEPVTELLAEYGEDTFNAIKAGNPDAIWVIQGWMFAYQREIWNQETVKALFSRVPDNEVLILDYANDYNNNWQPMNAFNGKQWVYGFVPNMGGKTVYTGNLALYASGSARAQNSPDKKNLVGFTISGEGLENNAVVYELLTDAAWSSDSVNLDSWLNNYCLNRYGACPTEMIESWKFLRESCYGQLVPHPQFGWQLGRCSIGTVNKDQIFHEATLKFLSCSDELGKSKGYCSDAIERAALTLGLKADEWFSSAAKAYTAADIAYGDKAGSRGLELLLEIDRLLESHPLNRLEPWLEFARAQSDDPEMKKLYESNARQIITVWGPPVNDYSCRVWSGLIRDFYYQRMKLTLDSLRKGEIFNSIPWEVEWVQSNHPISGIDPYPNPIHTAKELVQQALVEHL
ncbi:MAG: alpha-N-acetylglucosaminidase C-terminal domain-containing protein [Bacteroidales bacterium]|nr:alpha-N-acetylglucosaminidase C-terminal domain-containing protein [Bacteroidales bacterium]